MICGKPKKTFNNKRDESRSEVERRVIHMLTVENYFRQLAE